MHRTPSYARFICYNPKKQTIRFTCGLESLVSSRFLQILRFCVTTLDDGNNAKSGEKPCGIRTPTFQYLLVAMFWQHPSIIHK